MAKRTRDQKFNKSILTVNAQVNWWTNSRGSSVQNLLTDLKNWQRDDDLDVSMLRMYESWFARNARSQSPRTRLLSSRCFESCYYVSSVSLEYWPMRGQLKITLTNTRVFILCEGLVIILHQPIIIVIWPVAATSGVIIWSMTNKRASIIERVCH